MERVTHSKFFIAHWSYWLKNWLLTAILIIGSSIGCGPIPVEVSMDDTRVQALLESVSRGHRESCELSPIPKSAKKIELEMKAIGQYDAMLHIYAKTARTISFRRNKDEGYEWIAEQEVFQGPKQYTSNDGSFFEEIVLDCALPKSSEDAVPRFQISYHGDDPRLARQSELTLSDVKPTLTEWGY